MSFKLAIKPVVGVPVEFKVDDGSGTAALHRFSLKCLRVGVKEFTDAITDPESGEITNERIRTKLLELATGWEGQKFVLDEESGEPSAFSQDALAYMLDQFGVLDVVAKSFRKVCEAKAKN